jgi:ribonuclease PH
VEIQGTAEHKPFATGQMNAMMDLGREGIERLMQAQRIALKGLDLDL